MAPSLPCPARWIRRTLTVAARLRLAEDAAQGVVARGQRVAVGTGFRRQGRARPRIGTHIRAAAGDGLLGGLGEGVRRFDDGGFLVARDVLAVPAPLVGAGFRQSICVAAGDRDAVLIGKVIARGRRRRAQGSVLGQGEVGAGLGHRIAVPLRHRRGVRTGNVVAHLGRGGHRAAAFRDRETARAVAAEIAVGGGDGVRGRVRVISRHRVARFRHGGVVGHRLDERGRAAGVAVGLRGRARARRLGRARIAAGELVADGPPRHRGRIDSAKPLPIVVLAECRRLPHL